VKRNKSKERFLSKEVTKNESSKTLANTVPSIKEDEIMESSSFVERRQHSRYSVSAFLLLLAYLGVTFVRKDSTHRKKGRRKQ